jgi:hypothetical protein
VILINNLLNGASQDELPLMAMILVFQRKITFGLTAGVVKANLVDFINHDIIKV